MVHGFGEHSGRYSHVIERLVSESYEVFSIDFRGHGHSKGGRGDITSFGLYEDDVLAGFNYIENNLKTNNKLFLLAHSMGALVALRALRNAHFGVHGLVLSSPLFALKIPVPEWKRLLALAVIRVIPELRLGTGIKGRHLSSDRNFANAYDKDPLVLKNLSIRAFFEISDGLKDAHDLAKDVALPLLIQLAGNDPVVDSDAAEQWFRRLDQKHVDKSLKIYPGFLHEIYNETKRIEPIDDAIVWLNQRV